MKLVVPEPGLVLLVGAAGAGKSTFAQAHFRPTEIVSSDALRAMLADDPNEQAASGEAFRILTLLVAGRLRRRLLTVVDATNLRAETRRRLRRMASRHAVPAVAIAFDLPAELVRARNAGRIERQVLDSVVDSHIERLHGALAALPGEGFDRLYVLREPDLLGVVTVERSRPSP